jgi:hypothetical protein
MVLDPLSAFSVACNLLQVLDFGLKALTKAIDYRQASDGALPEHRDLGDVLNTLKSLNIDLQSSMVECGKTNPLSKAQARLEEANNKCLLVSTDFIDLLDRLKVKNQSALLECLRMGFKTLWYKDEMNRIKSTLSQVRDNLNIALLIYIRYEETMVILNISSNKGKF